MTKKRETTASRSRGHVRIAAKHAHSLRFEGAIVFDQTDPGLLETFRSMRVQDVAELVREELTSAIAKVPFVMTANMRVHRQEKTMTVKFTPNDKGNPPGKLADAELHFSGGPFDGLRLIGFAIWERKGGARNVTFPAKQYTVNGERRSFSLLRPITEGTAQDRLRDLILEAYKEYEQEMAVAS